MSLSIFFLVIGIVLIVIQAAFFIAVIFIPRPVYVPDAWGLLGVLSLIISGIFTYAGQ